MLNCTVLFFTVLNTRTALAEKGMTAEQYDKLTEMQRIKPKDDEEAKVHLALFCFVLSCLVVYFALFRLSFSINIIHFLFLPFISFSHYFILPS